jgi:glycine hydroxymethyltransferase
MVIVMADYRKEAHWIKDMVRKHHEWFSGSIPMIASENLISPLARELLLSDFMDRYAEGLPGERYYQGLIYVDDVERKVTALAKELFDCEYADVRPISGTNANLAVFFALAKPGQVMTTVNVPHGAHISSAKFGSAGVRGLDIHHYPFDIENMNIDVEKTKKFLKEIKPRFCLFGQSVYLFPTPLQELKDTLDELGCPVVYDAAHVLGLIAGGKFQDPLREGAHIINGSSHKTLPGPQHGIILANPSTINNEKWKKKMERKLIYGVFPGVLSNHHLHSMAALGVSLAEFLQFGKEYADQIVRNAKALGQALHERGIKVLCEHLGFTESHTLAVDVKEHGGGTKVVEDMEKANIIANKNLLPWDDVSTAIDPSGLRFGSQEMTRLGMKEKDMEHVAELIKKLAIDKKDPAEVKKEVIEFRNDFNTIHYCFTDGYEAYKFHSLVDD